MVSRGEVRGDAVRRWLAGSLVTVCNGRSAVSAGGSACAGDAEGLGPRPLARSLRCARAESIVVRVGRAERAASDCGRGGRRAE